MDRLLSKVCNRDEFALLYLKLLQETAPDLQFEMTGDMQIRMVNGSGKEATSFLHNAWVEYSRSTGDRRELLERHVTVASTLAHEPIPLETTQIVATVKDSQYVGTFEPKSDQVTEHLCGDLWIVYAQDLPDRILTVKREMLNKIGIDDAALRKVAMENLRRIMPAAEQHGEGPWFFLTAGGDYTASLLLFDGLWEDLADSVDGHLVAVAPARDVLLYTGSNSHEGLKAIREQAAHVVATGNYVVTDTLIVRAGDRWEVFKAN
jgi:uncharacterized protein YtpQ (UPF0354 family)